jgi:hypothetical protein
MFLVTILHPETFKLVRRSFHYLEDAENFCDYCSNCGLAIWELVLCD